MLEISPILWENACVMRQMIDRGNDYLTQRGFAEAAPRPHLETVSVEAAADIWAAIHFNEDIEQISFLALEASKKQLRGELLSIEAHPVVIAFMRQLQDGERLLCAATPPEKPSAGYSRALLYLTSEGFLISHSVTQVFAESISRIEEDQHLRFERILPGRRLPLAQLSDFAHHQVTDCMIIENLIAHASKIGVCSPSVEAGLRGLLEEAMAKDSSKAA